MLEIDTRTLCDGSATTITLAKDGERFVVTAKNAAGSSTVIVDREDAAECYMHPFSRSEWLDYPGINTNAIDAGLALAAVRAAELTDDGGETL